MSTCVSTSAIWGLDWEMDFSEKGITEMVKTKMEQNVHLLIRMGATNFEVGLAFADNLAIFA